MMKHILFVDDEQRILDGLKRTLRSMRDEWNMLFACGGEEALRWIRAVPYRYYHFGYVMPGMDGAQLLRKSSSDIPTSFESFCPGNPIRRWYCNRLVPRISFCLSPAKRRCFRRRFSGMCLAGGTEERQSSSGGRTDADHSEHAEALR